MPARITDFARAFTSNWLSYMSGGASVPFAGLGLILGDGWQAYLFFSLAALCIVIAAFFMWRAERERGDLLAERIRPKLRASFSMDDMACMVRDVTIQFIETVVSPLPAGFAVTAASHAGMLRNITHTLKGDYVRLRVETDSVVSVSGSKGRLNAIELDGKQILPEPLDLPFASSNSPDALNKTIHEGSAQHMDVLLMTDDGRAFVATRGFERPNTRGFDELFRKPGEYKLRLAVISEAPAIHVGLLFKWTGHRATSEITYEPS